MRKNKRHDEHVYIVAVFMAYHGRCGGSNTTDWRWDWDLYALMNILAFWVNVLGCDLLQSLMDLWVRRHHGYLLI